MDDLEYRIGKLELKPGDRLLAKFDANLSHDQVECIRANLADVIPDGVKILVLDKSVDLSVMTSDEVERVGFV
jgi:hypothetical protein